MSLFHEARRRFHAERLSSLPLLLLLGSIAAGIRADRPETVLLNLLAKPFVPTEWASERCLRDSAIYLQELESYAPWAIQMYDASAKIPAGVTTGGYKQLGNYDECLRVKSGHGFIGQACSAALQFEVTENDVEDRQPDIGDILRSIAIAANQSYWTSGESVTYEWTWCVPSSCSYSEIQEALEIALDPLKVEGRVDLVINVTKEACRTANDDRITFDLADWIYTFLIGAFALITIGSTGYDVAKQGQLRTLNRKDTKHVLLTSFSVYTNGKNLLRTERHGDSIECLDGLRFLSICWIIYGHTHYSEVVGVKMNLTEVSRMHLNWSSMLVLNGNIVTDTFFLLSGLLLAYTEMAKKHKVPDWRFDVIGLYIHRYLRLTPAYAMMIGFYATLFYKFGSGPHWDNWVGANRNYCRDNWWTNLLYINNYVNISDMCMSQSWYLATDMQLVWLSPIFLYPMLKFSRSTFFWLAFALGLLLSILLPFFITFYLRLTGTMLYYKEQLLVAAVYQQIYTRVYSRFGPYLIGLGLGYVLYKTRRSYTVKIWTPYIIAGWLIAIAAGLSVVFGPRGMYYEDHQYDRIEASFYAGFHRQVFVLAVSWIIFCCVHGYAGIVGHFLSWRGWIPLSKLTYSAYLCHYLFILSSAGSVRATGVLTTMGVVRAFFGNLCLTMFLSALWSLCFEMPFMALDRALVALKSHRSRLSPKPNMYGSTDSENIYRSTEETSSTVFRTDNEEDGRSCQDSVYNSEEDGRRRGNEHAERTREKSNYIYVISSADCKDDKNLDRRGYDVRVYGDLNDNLVERNSKDGPTFDSNRHPSKTVNS
ncbi:hypothetical protein KM043_004866 [Ampulex compressa]|nr:hypothetical protein KM043_004866 [Ampulex compressa]